MNAYSRRVASVILLSAFVVGLSGERARANDTAQAKEKPKVAVRSLILKDRRGLQAGGSGATLFASQEEIAKLLNENAARELGGQVDFTKEQVVWVQWTTMGPPYGSLLHEIKEGEVVFYVQKPPGRVGTTPRMGHDFFAVPANVKVKVR